MTFRGPVRTADPRSRSGGRGAGTLGLATAAVVGCALLAACGGGAPAATGSSAQSGSGAAGCQTGTAAPAGATTLTVAQEPDTGVNKITAACWASIAYTGMNNVSVPGVPSTDTGEFKVAWNAQNLYILAYVQKWPLFNAGSKEYMDDTVEFYLGGDAQHGSGYGPNDCHFDVTFDGTYGPGSSCNLSNYSSFKPMAQVVQNKGYYAELIAPWSALNVSKAAKGQQYAFTIQWDDANASGARVGQDQWSGGSNDDASKTQDWGTITLG